MPHVTVHFHFYTVFPETVISHITAFQVFDQFFLGFHPTVAVTIAQGLVGLLVDGNCVLADQGLVEFLQRPGQFLLLGLRKSCQFLTQKPYR